MITCDRLNRVINGTGINNRINYFQVVQQTDKQKFEMYVKLRKKELAKMLIEANKHLSNTFYVVELK